MIDSVVWKEKLSQDLRSVKKRSAQKRWTSRSVVLFERELILIFSAIRKLIEAGKLTDNLLKREYDCRAYLTKDGVVIDDITKYWIHEIYDLETGFDRKCSIRFLANQFIHAYVIYPDFWISGDVTGVLVCSDWEKYNALFHISFSTLINIVNDVVADEITGIFSHRDEKTGEMRMVKLL